MEEGGEATLARLLLPAEVGGAGDLDFLRGVGAAGEEIVPLLEGPAGGSKAICEVSWGQQRGLEGTGRGKVSWEQNHIFGQSDEMA